MEILVNPTSYQNAIDLINIKINSICVGTKETSDKNGCILTLEQIKKLLDNKKNTKILILINKYFFEKEIKDLEIFIEKICKLNIDGIIFADYAIPQILFEKKINNIKLIYNPETMVTNYGQFEFFLNNKIGEVAISRELNKQQINEILLNKKNMRIQMQVEGYSFMMQSRWKLLSNFRESHKIKNNLNFKKLYLKEETRETPFIVYEDDNGTYNYTAYNLSLLQFIYDLRGVDVIRIDGFLKDDKWVLETAKVYQDAIKLIKENKFENNKNDLIKRIKKINNGEIISSGFYTGGNELIYLKKE